MGEEQSGCVLISCVLWAKVPPTPPRGPRLPRFKMKMTALISAPQSLECISFTRGKRKLLKQRLLGPTLRVSDFTGGLGWVL